MTDTKKREKARQAPTYSHVGETGHFNFSPAGFRRWANQFYQCRQSFQCPDFSPVPYFLLCRAIELQFKAVHLEQLKAGHPGHQTQYDVKKLFNHKLIKSYEALPAADRTLSREQLKLLKKADVAKGSSMSTLINAGLGFSNFPDLKDLDELAKAIMTAPHFVQPGA
jgi:hypothetical protein